MAAMGEFAAAASEFEQGRDILCSFHLHPATLQGGVEMTHSTAKCTAGALSRSR